MSVKSERRAWFAVNVEPKPNAAIGSPEYMAWVKRANAEMSKRCVFGSAELRAESGAEVPAIAELRAALTGEPADYTIAAEVAGSPVIVAEVSHVDIAPVTPIAAKRKVAAPKRGRVKTTPLKVPTRVAVNALVTVAELQGVDILAGDVSNIARDARYLVLAAHPNRGFWWVQRFDGATGTMSDFFAARGASLKVAGNGVAAAEFAAQPLDIAA